MRQEKELKVDVHTHAQRAHRRVNGHSGRLQEVVHKEPDSPFPYLETIVAAAKKYPYGALGIMIGIASIVIASVTVLAVSIVGGMFLMYGQMREMSATQDTILKQQQVTATEVVDTGKIMRAYEAANGKRIEFIVGLMSRDQQYKMNEYDRTHPTPLIFGTDKEK